MEYKYKITRETLIKILPFICACSYALGILLIILTVNSEYPIVGFLMSGLCFVIGTVALVRHIKLKKETEKNTTTQTDNTPTENNIDNSKRLNKKQKIIIATSILLVILSGIFFIILGASIDEYAPCVIGGFWVGGGVAFLCLCIIEQKIEIKSTKEEMGNEKL